MKERNECINSLKAQLEQSFPIPQDINYFSVFPFCNEDGYYRLTRFLKSVRLKDRPAQDTNLSVAILIGESNFLSLLPHLKFVDVLLLADVEPRIHYHNEHLLKCIRNANTPEEFMSLYLQHNPLENEVNRLNKNRVHPVNIQEIHKDLIEKKSLNTISLKKYHFLFNQKRFDECKNAISDLPIVQIQLNMKSSESCINLAKIVASHRGSINLCNFTNIHHYIDENILKQTSQALLSHARDCLIMYAKGPVHSLTTHITENPNEYFSWICDLKKNNPNKTDNMLLAPLAIQTNNSSFFSITKKKDNKGSLRCYVGLVFVIADTINLLQSGLSNINQLDLIITAAQTSLEDAEQLINDTRERLLDNHIELREQELSLPPSWTIELQGSPDQINALFTQFIDVTREEPRICNSSAGEKHGWKFLSHMIKIYPYDLNPVAINSPKN